MKKESRKFCRGRTSLCQWKKYMRFNKSMLIDLKIEQFKRYPGTDLGKYPTQYKQEIYKMVQRKSYLENIEKN